MLERFARANGGAWAPATVSARRQGLGRGLQAGAAMLAIAICSLWPTEDARSEPHSTPVQIVSVRSYTTGNSANDFAQITTTNVSPCSNFSVYAISLATTAGQGMLAVATTALSTGRSVTLEVSNTTGCNAAIGGAPQLQSLTMLASGYNGPF